MNESFFATEQWEKTKKRYEAYWDGSLDRCLFALDIPNGKSGKSDWFDIDGRIDEIVEKATETIYLADSFPSSFPNFGPGCLAGCIGSDFVPDEHTIWFDRDPMLKEWDDVSKVNFDENCYMWSSIKEMTHGLSDYNHLLCTGVTDIGGTLDIIASLRGSETLLYDLMDYPDEVLDLIKKIEPMWEHMYNELVTPLIKKQGGMSSWMPIWCSGRYFPLQCDFSSMISPNMFKEFVLPNLVRQTEFLDNSVYHLDGPGEIPHLDHLLSIPTLDAIQWTPGAGKYTVTDDCWFEMYEKIFASGKGLVLFADTPEQAELLIRKFPKNRMFVDAHCTDAKYAEELVRLHETL